MHTSWLQTTAANGTNSAGQCSHIMQVVTSSPPTAKKKSLKVLTYNVHSCRGTDRRHDPGRIAEVIVACSPDIIALQELDVGRARTGGIDQASLIAEQLRMQAHFHPALHVEEEKYGDAILTSLPSRVIKAGPLPSTGESRGAIWIEIDVDGGKLQVLNTHLGLRSHERTTQAMALLTTDWLGSARCHDNPTILVGDFNAMPSSPAYRLLAQTFNPALPANTRRFHGTFPSRFPLLRLDHIFVNDRLNIASVEVVDNPLARRASDHLPLLAKVVLQGSMHDSRH